MSLEEVHGPRYLEMQKANQPKPVETFTYTEVDKPPSSSTSIMGPAVRLFATCVTLGVSEDIHKKIKKTLVSTLSNFLTASPSAMERKECVDEFKTDKHFNEASKLCVNIGEKAALDGMLIKPLDSKSEKYVIWLNGLGESYEAKLPLAGEYADFASANILVFNYRGCGDSTSRVPPQPKDLVTDTMAMIAFLTNKGVKPEDIVVHGFSLGGGVGALASQASETKHINDRSYSTFSKAAKEMVANQMKSKTGKTAANVIGFLTASLIKGYDLDLNTGKAYKAGLKDTLILHHPKDKTINKSSLKEFIEKHKVTSENPVKSNHKIVNLSNPNTKVDNAHETFFLDFVETSQNIATFIHDGKSIATTKPAPDVTYTETDTTADSKKLSEEEFDFELDLENLDSIDLGSLNLKSKPIEGEEI